MSSQEILGLLRTKQQKRLFEYKIVLINSKTELQFLGLFMILKKQSAFKSKLLLCTKKRLYISFKSYFHISLFLWRITILARRRLYYRYCRWLKLVYFVKKRVIRNAFSSVIVRTLFHSQLISTFAFNDLHNSTF